jgi:hypothetical protein
MNPLFYLLGAAANNLTDYPKEIRDLRGRVPKSERDAVLKQYKKLPRNQKSDFKAALRHADLAAASKILGQDVGKYYTEAKKNDKTTADVAMKAAVETKLANVTPTQGGSDIIARVNKLLAVPTSIDPDLLAEAARRYEEAVPSGSNLSITEKTKRLTDIAG